MTEPTKIRVSITVPTTLDIEVPVCAAAEDALGKSAHEIAKDYVRHAFLCGVPVTWKQRDMDEPDPFKAGELTLTAVEIAPAEPDLAPMVLTGEVLAP
jgi:hypothetical protein